MILGLPTQTQQTNKNFYGWGCAAHCFAATVQNEARRVMPWYTLATVIQESIDAGYILDNDLPLDGSKGEWYRCYVTNPEGFAARVAIKLGGRLKKFNQLVIGPTWTPPPKGYNYLMAYHRDEYSIKKKDGSYTGGHFTVADARPEPREEEDYNPWPGLKMFEVMKWRYIECRLTF